MSAGGGPGIAQSGEMGAVVGQNRVDLVRDRLDEHAQELGGLPARARSTRRAKANLEVRSTATKR